MKREELQRAMEALNVAVSDKPTVEEMGCYRIKGDRMRASDGRSLVEVKLSEDTGLDCTVPAKGIFKLVKDLSATDVELVIVEHSICVKSGTLVGEFNLAIGPGMLDDIDFSVEKWRDCTEAMKVGVRKVRFAAASDSSRPVYCGTLISGKNVVASNGVQIAAFESKVGSFLDGEESVILSADAAALLDRWASKVKRWSVEKGNVYFATDSVVFGLRLQVGEYTNKIWTFLEKANELDKEVKLPDDTAAIVGRQDDQLDGLRDQDKQVLMTVSGGKMTISTTDNVRFRLKESAPIQAEASFEFAINPKSLIDAAKSHSTMRYGDHPFIAFVEDSEMANFRYLSTIDKPRRAV